MVISRVNVVHLLELTMQEQLRVSWIEGMQMPKILNYHLKELMNV